MNTKISSIIHHQSSTSTIRDYISLLKPRVMSLVVFTGLAGLLLAPGHIHPFIAGIAIFCIALGSGASGAINMWYERESDGLMKRTQNRPLPAGRIDADSAIEFAVILAGVSVFIMAVAVNYLAALLLLSAICFYVFIYTVWLKTRTPQNIVIGGAAGAFPPLIGWAAVTGDLSMMPLLLFLIIFLWTPPHFWALALYRSDDYKNAGIPMLPVVRGVKETKKQIIIYSVLLVFSSILPFLYHFSGKIYALGAVLLGAKFLQHSLLVYKDNKEETAGKTSIAMFKFSIYYLFLLFTLLLVDKYAHW